VDETIQDRVRRRVGTVNFIPALLSFSVRRRELVDRGWKVGVLNDSARKAR
jgi:hypothetical protein